MGMTYTVCSVCGRPLLIDDFDLFRFGETCEDCRAAGHTCRVDQQGTRTYKIYQLDLDRPEAIQYAFQPLSRVADAIEQGCQLVYDLVYSGKIVCDKDWCEGQVLERLFHIFNVNHPDDYKGRSLSISDVVWLDGGDGGKYYCCEPCGFTLFPYIHLLKG